LQLKHVQEHFKFKRILKDSIANHRNSEYRDKLHILDKEGNFVHGDVGGASWESDQDSIYKTQNIENNENKHTIQNNE
jgi:hypothetical protein